MGCYDTIEVNCPECGSVYHAQSKGGACNLKHYTLENAPNDVLSDVNRHAPFICDNCNTVFQVYFPKPRTVEW